LFKVDGNDKLSLIDERNFKLEKDIQQLTEINLETIFNLQFVKSEFSLGQFRLDSLAFDNETKSFVIIEYKRDKSFSVIDQGYAYLALMLNNKADFILEYNEVNEAALKRNDVDWSQSRIIFVSPFFTTYQKEAINFKDLPIELWEVKRFENRMVAYNHVQTSGATESIKKVSRQSDAITSVSKEIRVYTEQDHVQKASDEIVELYEQVKLAILNLGEMQIKYKKLYIAFVSKSNVVDIHIQKNALKMWINLKAGELDDPKGIARDVSSTGHWGNGDYELQISNNEHLEYILSLIKQVLKKR